MDIGKGHGWPGSALTNFAPHEFILDGIIIKSMEGFLQALKFDKVHIQEQVCQLVGKAAKFRGKKRNKAWKRVQKLWWQGKEYDRHGEEYQQLLDRAFNALAQNKSFQKALLVTQGATLTHSLGKRKKSETVLTISEFISRLVRLRTELQKSA